MRYYFTILVAYFAFCVDVLLRVSSSIPCYNHELISLSSFKALDAYLKSLEPEIAPLKSDAKQKKVSDVKEAGTKRKGSRGAESLKKANVKGMAKISDMFKKAKK